MEKENHGGFTLMIQQDGSKDDLDWCIEFYFSKNKDLFTGLYIVLHLDEQIEGKEGQKYRWMDGRTLSREREVPL